MSFCPTSLKSAPGPRVLDWTVSCTCQEAHRVLVWIWQESSPTLSVLLDLWLRGGKNSPSRPNYSVETTRYDAWWKWFHQSRSFWRHNLTLRLLPVKRCAVPLWRIPWWCLYLRLYIAYRWPHLSISHNSAARRESRGPLHSSVIFHCSSSPCYSSSQRNWVSIVNIPPGSQRRSACVLRSSRVAFSPIRACWVTGAYCKSPPARTKRKVSQED